VTGFEYRGVIEGFYGTPWPHEDRLWMLERMGAWGMNLYVYAPKNDPLHRERWREPYSDAQMREFRELVVRGASVGVQVGFAISPGLSIRYASADDRAALASKFQSFRDLGSGFLSLALDDVPSRLVHEADRGEFGSLAEAHVGVVRDVRKQLGSDVSLWLVPTDYLGVDSGAYLEELGEHLDPDVEVGWTGRTVVSPTIRAEEAARRSATLRRPLLLWDNVPVSDGPMRSMLHLGPYAGRDSGLRGHARGVLLNPMEHAHASGVAIRTAAAFLVDPERYDQEREWTDAIAEIGEGDPEAFRTFAEAHRFHPISPDDRDRELEAGYSALRSQLERQGEVSSLLEELNRQVEVRLACAQRLRANLRDPRLREEIDPWVESHGRETRRIQASLDALGRMLVGGTAAERCIAFLALEARIGREPTPIAQSYGPRRVLYPQLASMGEEAMGLGSDPCLFRDRCLADAFVELVEDLAVARLRTD
jgi:hyaluronoglucosaminidase